MLRIIICSILLIGLSGKWVDLNAQIRILTRSSHDKDILAINFSDDGKYFLTSGLDGKIKLWLAEADVCIRTYTTISGASADTTFTNQIPYNVFFGPGNKSFIYSDRGTSVEIDIHTGKVLHQFPGVGGVAGINRNKNILFSSGAGYTDTVMVVYDLISGKELKRYGRNSGMNPEITFHTNCVTCGYQAKMVNDSLLAYVNEESFITVIELNDGKEVSKIPGLYVVYDFDVDQKTNSIILNHDDTTMIYSSGGKLINKILSGADCSYKILYAGDNILYAAGYSGMLYRINLSSGKIEKEYKIGAEGCNGQIEAMAFTPDKKYLYAALTECNALFKIDVELGQTSKITLLTSPVDRITVSEESDRIACFTKENHHGYLINLNNTTKKNFKKSRRGVCEFDFFNNEYLVFSGNYKITAYDIENGNERKINNEYLPCVPNLAYLAKDKQYVLIGGERPEGRVAVFDRSSGKTASLFRGGEFQIRDLVQGNGNYIYSVGHSGGVYKWDISRPYKYIYDTTYMEIGGRNTMVLKKINYFTPSTDSFDYRIRTKISGELKRPKYSKTDEKKTGTPEKKAADWSARPVYAHQVRASPGENYLATCGWGDINVWDINTRKRIIRAKNPEGYSLLFLSENHLAVGDLQGRIFRFDFLDNRSEFVSKVADGKIRHIAPIKRKNISYAISSDDNSVVFCDSLFQPVVYSMSLDEDESFFYDTAGYYFGSKNFISQCFFMVDSVLYSFGQFDLKFNRPDIIMSELGCVDQEKLDMYYLAYKKRLAKMKMTEEQLSKDYHVPVVTIENKLEIPVTTSQKKIKINMHALDTKYSINHINIFVNGVPLLGSAGKNLRELGVKEYRETYEVELLPGNNKIELEAVNTVGASAMRVPCIVQCRVEKEKPDLYVIAIGVSKFKDRSANLKYPVKDVSDLVDLLKTDSLNFRSKHLYSLYDKEATRENILALKNKLSVARPNDVVILYVSTHGVLDENLDYYLATTDINFNSPSIKGLKYEELEGLLDGISSRKKLLLLDACHAGELDKEEIMKPDTSRSFTANVVFRSSPGAKGKGDEWSMNNTFDLMKDLFADLQNSTGSTIIAAARGGEYALEGEDWSNGVFTFTILEGLGDRKADIDGDGLIKVSELHEYVSERVNELTGGEQNPSSRTFNADADFILWNSVKK